MRGSLVVFARHRTVALLLAVGVALAAIVVALPADAGRADASAVIRDTDGRALGLALFDAQDRSVKVTVALRAPLATVPAGFHGFHIHENGTCSPDFSAAGGHYNPTGADHGDHAGDLPSPEVFARGRFGVAHLTTYTSRFKVADVVGKAVILHAGRDNFNNVPTGDADTDYTPNTPAAVEATAATGNAGARTGCGVIRWR